MIPVLANVKLWMAGAAIAAVSILLAMLKINSVKLDLSQEKIKAKKKQIENMAETVKIQNEKRELSEHAHQIREKIASDSRSANRIELSKYNRD